MTAIYRYTWRSTHRGEKSSNFAESSVHVSLLATCRDRLSKREKWKSPIGRRDTTYNTPVIELDVRPDRESRANWARRASNGNTRALFAAGSCQRAWYALLPPVRPSARPPVHTSLALYHMSACVRIIHTHVCPAASSVRLQGDRESFTHEIDTGRNQ